MQLVEIKETYDKTAEEYDRLLTPCRMCQFLTLIHELNLKGNEKVLEVGCGPGALSIEIGKLLQNGEVIGVDLSENMVKLASAKARKLELKNVDFAMGNALNLQFPNESFDVVVTSQLLHWIPDVPRFLSEIWRVMHIGGKLGLISPTPELYAEMRRAYQNIMKKYYAYYEGTETKEMIGLRIYSEEETQKLLFSAGFSITKTFVMNFKEPITPEAYIKRIDAITDGRYLDPIPKELRETARKELISELRLSRNSLKTTECSVFIIGCKRSQKEE
jgi:ubiquinone/menaquinone biosynthesis C-methylase UbiE